MKRAIREHLRDFIAIIALFVAGLLVTGYILSQQQQPYPSWIPFLGDDRFELKAELSSAQAVTPGQGQTVNIAGVKAGDISEVELVDGTAVVTMLVEEQYAPILR
ncbi:MAG TPA: MCE family protein, partial [Solirubrobacterales bacterium]|nr:MCE family protein [Solirubrobacterales bacterium]